MERSPYFSESESNRLRIENAKNEAYSKVCPDMNRKERRTAKGKMLHAQGIAAALKAENELLRNELRKNGYED